MNFWDNAVAEKLVFNQLKKKNAKEFDATPVYLFADFWKTIFTIGHTEESKNERFIKALVHFLLRARAVCKTQQLEMSFLDVIFTDELSAPKKTASDFKACMQTINDRIAAATPEQHTEMVAAMTDSGWKGDDFLFCNYPISEFDRLFLAEVIRRYGVSTAITILCDFNASSDIKVLAAILDRVYLHFHSRGIYLLDSDKTRIGEVRMLAKTTSGAAKKAMKNCWPVVHEYLREEALVISNLVTKRLQEKKTGLAIVTKHEQDKTTCKDSEKEMVTSLVMDSDRTEAELSTFFEKLRETIDAQAKSKAAVPKLAAAPAPAPAPAPTGVAETETKTDVPLAFWFCRDSNPLPEVKDPKIQVTFTDLGKLDIASMSVQEPKPKKKTASDQIAADAIEIAECALLLEHVTNVLEAERGTFDKLSPWRHHPDSDKWIDDYVDTVSAKFMARFDNDEETVALYAGQLGCLPCACLDVLFGVKPSSVYSANIVEFANDIVHNFYQDRVFQNRIKDVKRRSAEQSAKQAKTGAIDTDATFRVMYSSTSEKIVITVTKVMVPYVTSVVPVRYDIYNELGVYVESKDFVRLKGVTCAGLAAGFREHDLVHISLMENILVSCYFGNITRAIDVRRLSRTPRADSWEYCRTATAPNLVKDNSAQAAAQMALKQAIDYEQEIYGSKFHFSTHDVQVNSEDWKQFSYQRVECIIAWSESEQSRFYGVRILTDLGKKGNSVQNGDIITNSSAMMFSLGNTDDTTQRIFRPLTAPTSSDGQEAAPCMWISARMTSVNDRAKQLLKLVGPDLVIQENFSPNIRKGDTVLCIGSELADQQVLTDAKRMLRIFDNLKLTLLVKRSLPAVEDRWPEVGTAITIPLLNNSGLATDLGSIVTHVEPLAQSSGIRVGDRVSRVFYTDAYGCEHHMRDSNPKWDRKVILVHTLCKRGINASATPMPLVKEAKAPVSWSVAQETTWTIPKNCTLVDSISSSSAEAIAPSSSSAEAIAPSSSSSSAEAIAPSSSSAETIAPSSSSSSAETIVPTPAETVAPLTTETTIAPSSSSSSFSSDETISKATLERGWWPF